VVLWKYFLCRNAICWFVNNRHYGSVAFCAGGLQKISERNKGANFFGTDSALTAGVLIIFPIY
jgi:hypothetical protein